MSAEAGRAVFLSYASQDAGAAQRICGALRAAGIEVWFDQSELRGGDAWDGKIRRQIKECALFVPLISATTQARGEGYFRLEWHLAEQRSHLIARGRPFVVPVAIDATTDADALVPDAFLSVQWMRLPGGEANPAFIERLGALLAGAETARVSRPAIAEPTGQKIRAARSSWVWAAAGVLAAIAAVAFWHPWRQSEKTTAAGAPAAAGPAVSPSAARQLATRALGMAMEPDPSRETLESAGQLIDQAKALDPADADVWAVGAEVDAWFVFYLFDTSGARKDRASSGSARALSLDPKSYEARLARAFVLITVVAQPSVRAEAQAVLRTLLKEEPDDHRVLELLAQLLRDQGRQGEAADMFKRAKSFNAAGWAYFLAGRFDEAAAVIDQALASDRSVPNLELKSMIESAGREDLDAAQAALDQLPASALLEDHPASVAVYLRLQRREPEKMLEILRAIPRDWLSSSQFVGPKAFLSGEAHALAHRPEAAQADWRAALQLVEQRLAIEANAPDLLLWKAELLADLGESKEAARLLDLEEQLSGPNAGDFNHLLERKRISLLLGRRDAVMDWLGTSLKNPAGIPFLHAIVRFSPAFDPLRGDPRFEKLLRDTLSAGAKPFAVAVGH
jgi:tetratricopeptide (TPR) repeat protein